MSGSRNENGPITLRRSRDEVRAALDARIAEGEALRQRAAAANINQPAEVGRLRDDVQNWDDYNDTLLPSLFSGPILREYQTSVGFAGRADTISVLRDLNDDLDYFLRRLASIVSRLDLWDVETPGNGAAAGTASRPTDPKIFLVHGRDEARKDAVARVVEKCTRLDVTVLHEQANFGRTLIEKFEAHATETTFAIINLTGDDVGRAASATDLNKRARQNVIFEMGFFFGSLGRKHVAVLVDPDVEKPSDVDGIVYIELDRAGDWKRKLSREIEAAGIPVDYSRIP